MHNTTYICVLQHTVRAPRDGKVEKVNCSAGQSVTKNAVLVKFVD